MHFRSNMMESIQKGNGEIEVPTPADSQKSKSIPEGKKHEDCVFDPSIILVAEERIEKFIKSNSFEPNQTILSEIGFRNTNYAKEFRLCYDSLNGIVGSNDSASVSMIKRILDMCNEIVHVIARASEETGKEILVQYEKEIEYLNKLTAEYKEITSTAYGDENNKALASLYDKLTSNNPIELFYDIFNALCMLLDQYISLKVVEIQLNEKNQMIFSMKIKNDGLVFYAPSFECEPSSEQIKRQLRIIDYCGFPDTEYRVVGRDQIQNSQISIIDNYVQQIGIKIADDEFLQHIKLLSIIAAEILIDANTMDSSDIKIHTFNGWEILTFSHPVPLQNYAKWLHSITGDILMIQTMPFVESLPPVDDNPYLEIINNIFDNWKKIIHPIREIEDFQIRALYHKFAISTALEAIYNIPAEDACVFFIDDEDLDNPVKILTDLMIEDRSELISSIRYLILYN